MAKGYDWATIKTEYEEEVKSMRELSEEYGFNLNYGKRKAENEGWEKESEKNRGRGRPRSYMPEELEEEIQNYFDSITITEPATKTIEDGKDEDGTTQYKEVPVLNNKGEQVMRTRYFEHPSITGMSLYLGIHRDTLHNYSTQGAYSDTIKKAKARIELYLENKLYGNSVTGIIFNLKNNYGWKDKKEIDMGITEIPQVVFKKSDK